jgi:pimeloyl-ACP methyl ester carboxylesterase
MELSLLTVYTVVASLYYPKFKYTASHLQYRKLNRTKSMKLSLGLLLLGILTLFCLSTSIFKQQDPAYAQSDIQTIKYRNLVIDLGNGVKTNAQLTLPAIGNGPFPGILLVPGSGATDMNEHVGKNAAPFLQISQYLSERGFAVLKYDKRGIGENGTVLDKNVWGNTTFTNLKQDAEKALAVLIKQPEVDQSKITILGHSEGTVIVPRIAIEDNATKIKNIVLMGAVAQNFLNIEYYQSIPEPLQYAMQVLDKNHTGFISIQQIAKAPILLLNLPVPKSFLHDLSLHPNNTTAIYNAIAKEFGTNNSISIDKQLKPALIEYYNNQTSLNPLQCDKIQGPVVSMSEGCPIWLKSHYALEPTLNIIGNVPSTTSILILQGQNDSQTPVKQAFLLQQALTDKKHPDHTLITYPNLGHVFYPSSEWLTSPGPIQSYVLSDLYAWLENHSGLSHSFVTTTATTSTVGEANNSSLNKNTTTD